MIHVAVHGIAFLALGSVLWFSGRILSAHLPDLGRFRHLASFCLGLAWWTAGLFALAAAGFLNRWGLALLALPLVARAFLVRSPRASQTESSRIGTAELLFGLFLAGVFLLTFFLAISPPVSWDADVYHLTLPRLYLESGGFRPVEMNVYSNWPLLTELFFAAAMLVDDYMLAKAVHFGFGLLSVYALFVAFPAPGSRIAGGLAAAFFLANDVVAGELRAAYVDLASAFFFLSAFLFLDRALDEREDRRGAFLLLSGLCCGLLAGVKVTGIAAAGVIGALYVPRLVRRWRQEWRPFVTRFALPVILLWMPWLVKAAWYTGNPFYPFFHGWLGGRDWSADLSDRLGEWQSSIGMGREPLDYLLLPLRLILRGGRGYGSFDGEISRFWIVLVPLAVVLARRHATARRALAAAGLSFVFWALTSQQMRFLIPVLALLSIAGAVAVLALLDRLPPAGRGGLALALSAALVLTVHADGLAAGARTLLAFSRVPGDLADTVVPEHHRFINDEVPEDARVLFVNTNLGFFCRRDYLADSFFEASQIADWLGDAESVEEVRHRLGERGVTHVLVDARPRVRNLPRSLTALLGDPARAEPVFRAADGRFAVLELR